MRRGTFSSYSPIFVETIDTGFGQHSRRPQPEQIGFKLLFVRIIVVMVAEV